MEKILNFKDENITQTSDEKIILAKIIKINIFKIFLKKKHFQRKIIKKILISKCNFFFSKILIKKKVSEKT